MEEKAVLQSIDRDVFTSKEVKEMIAKRIQRTRNSFYSRYGVKNLEELDALFEDSLRLKSQPIVEEEIKEEKEESNSLTYSLDELIGLEKIKEKINRLIALAMKNKAANIKMSMNYVFLGGPGTGKTITARALAKTFYEKGIIKEDKLVEVDRSQIIGEYIGKTAPLLRRVFESALGGVLFIDEAYLLDMGVSSNKDYGYEALGELNKLMEDYRGELVVILAGYKEEMKEMLKINRGIHSRINAYLEFKEYSKAELISILNLIASKYKYVLDEKIQNRIVAIATRKTYGKGHSSTRELRNIVEGLAEYQAVRTIDEPDNRTITEDDLLEWQIENKIVLDTDVVEA